MDIFAPFAGIVRFTVEDGQVVDTGEKLAVVEAVKLESTVEAPGPGVARRGAVDDFADVAGGDLLLSLEQVDAAHAAGEEGATEQSEEEQK
ncbi:MAG TPA: acetyl-CoA carboxylase biotin carboxyl carrier protein subunit [Candidatus Corynebacterium avicola]|uniref:Acetyl-CoA carboxylase biotin carboxyl carrier protein subunit n=1 Tax=Candidatus Corynebacterium avicola TaxID=2838527 RepID=A0A9D1RRZ5_9CORY|nr:acetyl-CoA carboxylase biotin carboxyl carrier protein subunit [Candidatus Corynebacterium avicola]